MSDPVPGIENARDVLGAFDCVQLDLINRTEQLRRREAQLLKACVSIIDTSISSSAVLQAREWMAELQKVGK